MSDDNRVTLVRDWSTSVDALKQAKINEKELRDAVTEAYFDEDMTGTNTSVVNNKASLKMVRSKRTSIDKDLFEAKMTYLNQKGLIGDDKLIKLTPSVSASALKYLGDSDKLALDGLFKVSYGAPTLSIVLNKE